MRTRLAMVWMVMLAGWFSSACSVYAADNLNGQVLAKAEAAIKAKMSKCGSNWFTTSEGGILEMKDISFRTLNEKLTLADQANNVTWRGLIIFESKLWRTYSSYKNAWGQWQDGQLMANEPSGRGLRPLKDPRTIMVDYIVGQGPWGRRPVSKVSMVNGNLRWEPEYLQYMDVLDCARVPR